MTLRPVSLNYFLPESPSVIRGNNFTVSCFQGQDATAFSFGSTDETILISARNQASVTLNGVETQILPRSVAILPAGNMEIGIPKNGQVFALTTGLIDDANPVLNAEAYAQEDTRVRPVGQPLKVNHPKAHEVHVYPIDEVPFPVGNPRLKFLQSATMSINWVEYQGPRDRTKLSPHAHDDFEQGSLAIEGDFIHHIRAPWARDANTWLEDAHLEASAGSLAIIPPDLIHTTEGVGVGPHILIDVFGPVRRDFVEKGWMHNAGDYTSSS
ncbi:hypothetical protein EOK75_16820 (plasmid) [Pseudorhodobacter turbinis]|uniref:5-deoxy-glucuronate isomerase n=1 Tax=Pseudorhodobacter turbinis TaxID=2500533 RepID=A0A4P8EKF4_9RHOB|nr:hypothetical protein [Pseudorhodobacter turbinis]QCO57383.1 hypothetical protein EOK75_16820 [Pseudorhodobacter turbinis]